MQTLDQPGKEAGVSRRGGVGSRETAPEGGVGSGPPVCACTGGAVLHSAELWSEREI